MSATPTGLLFYEPRAKPLSANGQLQPGAYYQFYQTGTTTPANVYADGGLTTPLSQTPGTGGTTAASDGRLVAIYMDPSVTYRVQLYSASAVLLEDIDPYIPGGIVTQQSLGLILYPRTAVEIAAGVTPTNYIYPNGPFRYGATGNGTTDDSGCWNTMGKVSGFHFVFDGNYLFNSKVNTQQFVTINGTGRQLTQVTGNFPDYLMEIGISTSGSNPNVGELKRMAFRGVGASNLGCLHMMPGSHMWRLDELLFQSCACPAFVNDGCEDANYTNIDILSCSQGVVIKNGSNNLYFRGLRIEQCQNGPLSITTAPEIWINEGKIDQGFIGGQTAPCVHIDLNSRVSIDNFAIEGNLGQYTFQVEGEMRLGDVFVTGGTNMPSHILDRRPWLLNNAITQPTYSPAFWGPALLRLDLGSSEWYAAHPSVSTLTPAVVDSNQGSLRVINQVTTISNGVVQGNSILIGSNVSLTVNNQFINCYLVHNSTGTQASGQPGARRKIIACFVGGNLQLEGTWPVTLDNDWSLEYSGGHYTQIETDNIIMEPGMDLFRQITTGLSITNTPTYTPATSSPAPGMTSFTVSAPAASTSVVGYYLVDDITGEPYLIGYGVDGSGTMAIMYDYTGVGDPTRFIDTQHTFSIWAGYSPGIHKVDDSYVWNFAGQDHTVTIAQANLMGYDYSNLPLWGCGTAAKSEAAMGYKFVGQKKVTNAGGGSTAFNFDMGSQVGGLYLVERGATSGAAYSHRVSYFVETTSGTFVEQPTRTVDIQAGSAVVATDTVTRSGANIVVTVGVTAAGVTFTNYANVTKKN